MPSGTGPYRENAIPEQTLLERRRQELLNWILNSETDDWRLSNKEKMCAYPKEKHITLTYDGLVYLGIYDSWLIKFNNEETVKLKDKALKLRKEINEIITLQYLDTALENNK